VQIKLAQISTIPSVKYGIVGKNRVVTSYVVSTDGPDDVHIKCFIANKRRLACEVEFSSTSQVSQQSMPGTDYDTAINVHIYHTVSQAMLAAMSQVCWRHMRTMNQAYV